MLSLELLIRTQKYGKSIDIVFVLKRIFQKINSVFILKFKITNSLGIREFHLNIPQKRYIKYSFTGIA